MKKELLNYIVCPKCKSSLNLQKGYIEENTEIKSGKIICSRCNSTFNIINYIPNFIGETTISFKDWEDQWNDNDFEFNQDDNDFGSDKDVFESDYKLNEFDFNNNFVLESGCGGGRITNILYKNNVKAYFCIDISNAIYEARNKHKLKKKIYFIKGDSSKLCFKNNFFDKIFLIAVLQHTENPFETILNSSRILKKKGYFFGGNYLLPENLVVRLRFHFTEIIRYLFKIFKISKNFRKSFCKFSIYSNKYFILRPLQWIFFNNSLPKNCSDKFRWLNNHDYYNPNIYQHMMTREETKNLFLNHSLTPILETKSTPNSYVFIKNI